MNIVVSTATVIWMVAYVVAICGAGAIVLAVQRRWFLHEDEDQSFVLPCIAAFGVGIIFLSVAIRHV